MILDKFFKRKEKAMKNTIYIVGKSGSGKSTLAKEFANFSGGKEFHVIKSKTTRRVRENDPNDINTHVFVGVDEYLEDFNKNKIIALYKSDEGYYNYVTNDLFSRNRTNIFVIDPSECLRMVTEYGCRAVIVLSPDDEVIAKRLAKRGDVVPKTDTTILMDALDDLPPETNVIEFRNESVDRIFTKSYIRTLRDKNKREVMELADFLVNNDYL